MIVSIAVLISFALVAFILPRILMLSLRKRLIDPIDPRKVHNVPASRLGGISFLPAIFVSIWSVILLSDLLPTLIMPFENSIRLTLECLSLLILFMVGVYDDILGVSFRKKFVTQAVAALVIIASGTYFTTLNGLFGIYDINQYVGIAITLIFYIFVTNAVNLIDGIDGLASLLSSMAIFVYGIILYIENNMGGSVMAFATLGAVMPFCHHNIYGVKRGATSKIFMGDTGSLVIGAILGFTAVKIWNSAAIYDTTTLPREVIATMAYTMLLVPCFDVVRVVVHRYRMHKPLFLPDKSHIHHKFLALGVSARQSLEWIIFINICFMAINFALSFAGVKLIFVMLIDALLFSIFQIYLSKLISKREL